MFILLLLASGLFGKEGAEYHYAGSREAWLGIRPYMARKRVSHFF